MTSFPSADFTSLPPWSLSHTFYRAHSDPTNPKTSGDNRHLHLLQVSSIPSKTIICTFGENEATTAVAISQGAATSDLNRLLKDKLSMIWQPLKQGDLHVPNGVSCEVGMFRFAVGDLVRDRGAASGGIENRGTVLGISVMEDENMEQGAQQGKGMLLELCNDLEFLGPQADLKLVVQSSGDFQDWNAEAKLWCDVLRRLVLGSGNKARGASEQGL